MQNGFSIFWQWQLHHRNKELFYIYHMNFWVKMNVSHLNRSLNKVILLNKLQNQSAMHMETEKYTRMYT